MTLPAINGSKPGTEDKTLAYPTPRERKPPVPSPELDVLLQVYTAKKRPNPKDKAMIKKIISFWQGLNGEIARCELCEDRNALEVKLLEIHHEDENPSNNEIRNLFLAHHPCNSKEHINRYHRRATLNAARRTLPVSESMYASAATAASREKEDSQIMKPRWHAWITDLEHGAFSKTRVWYYDSLAESAPTILGIGSSITYYRYIREYVAGGWLDFGEDAEEKKLVIWKGQPRARYLPKEHKP